MSQTTKGFDVYKNGTYLGFVVGQSKQVRVAVARRLVQSTHMATWHKTEKGFEYATTIGVYLLFEPVKRLSEMQGNYLLDVWS